MVSNAQLRVQSVDRLQWVFYGLLGDVPILPANGIFQIVLADTGDAAKNIIQLVLKNLQLSSILYWYVII